MKNLSIATLALLTLFATTQAAAETDKTGFYVGGAINNIKLDVVDSNFDEAGIGFGVYAGYNFNEWFGLESNLFVSGDLGDNHSDIGAGALTLTPKLTLQFNDVFSGYVKAGLASMAVVEEVSGEGDVDFSGIGWAYGLGFNAAVTEQLNIRLSYDITRGDLDSDDFYFDADNIDMKISQFALGMHYQF
ncbi:porin family protein [Shewanella salipaludis]|uniref:Porin family protein n=1 Tax=Shewanella salipaludis TaxID=2723052 RepID=A0A972FW50_9GAMM|nr:porin family protein [Shewanella salipaludis]NMH67165.1 porin family protein [Shewanella salipaludis]